MSEHYKLYGIVGDPIFAAARTGNLARAEHNDYQRKPGKDVDHQCHFGGGGYSKYNIWGCQ
jgi:hypothetical protein